MSVDMSTSINNAATGAYRITSSAVKKEAPAGTTAETGESAGTSFGEAAVFEKSSAQSTGSTGAVYEKSSATTAAAASSDTKTGAASSDTNKVSSKEAQHSAIVAQLKADQEARQSQLMEIVKKTMGGQGAALAKADDMWKFLAEGNFTVDADTKAQAQADIAEDGYWGVEQTSDRILDFAKALAGDDPSKADKMLDAFKKGFEEATKTWGKKLPDLTKQTYDSVLKKFDDWKNSANKTEANTDTAAASSGGVKVSKNPNYNTADTAAQQSAAATQVGETTA